MKYLFITMLALLSFNLFAGDSGLYYDAERDGEGILMLRDDDKVVTYLFTYGEFRCHNKDPKPSPSTDDEIDCDLDGQRWFFGSDEYEAIPEEVSGTLYIGEGLDYPFGVKDIFDPFVQNVGKAVEAGEYILRRREEGWRMYVGWTKKSVLDKDDILFEKVFEFRTQLFEVDEGIGPDPK